MFCFDVHLRQIVLATFSDRYETQMSNDELTELVVSKYDISCVAPQFMCQGLYCQFCTDIDVNRAYQHSSDMFSGCLPED
ncbi:hypothetical protein OESDEN_03898 [Oesophagostomum dentatum]|uniref:Uncharacterized protein n=1 Tax=Oesophagostomum dentatum TaxID=61180 RepID=A0A0B1TLA0_OESDE|nr:hypothetical protein OESDEN_03898 [Oesophagostomum dentatum]